MANALLHDRIGAVTGAGSGIGQSIALRFAEEGAKVAVIDVDGEAAQETASRIRGAGGKAEAFQCDVADEAEFRAAGAAIGDSLGRVDVVVNNAGRLRPSPLSATTLDEWDAVLSVNLTAAFISTLVFGSAMRAAGRGAFIHIGSIASQFAQTGGGAYSASKAGLCGLSSTIAAEWGPDGIRSNVVHPGLIRTALTEKFYADPELNARRVATVASRRTGVPGDVAAVAAFLASDLAAYVNGAELNVDGGFSRMAIDLIPRPGYS